MNCTPSNYYLPTTFQSQPSVQYDQRYSSEMTYAQPLPLPQHQQLPNYYMMQSHSSPNVVESNVQPIIPCSVNSALDRFSRPPPPLPQSQHVNAYHQYKGYSIADIITKATPSPNYTPQLPSMAIIRAVPPPPQSKHDVGSARLPFSSREVVQMNRMVCCFFLVFISTQR